MDLSKEYLDSTHTPEQLVGLPKLVGGGCELDWVKMAVPVVQAVRASSGCFPSMSQSHVSTEKEEVVGLCIGVLNGDLSSDSQFTYTGTEICTVAEKLTSTEVFMFILSSSCNVLIRGRIEWKFLQIVVCGLNRGREIGSTNRSPDESCRLVLFPSSCNSLAFTC